MIAQPGNYRDFSYLIWDEGWSAFERRFTGTGPVLNASRAQGSSIWSSVRNTT
jgi:hypothetical protein